MFENSWGKKKLLDGGLNSLSLSLLENMLPRFLG